MNQYFIPVSNNVSETQVRQDELGEYFRLIAEQGHYRGRTRPTTTRQGLYTATASGKLLVSVNSTQPGRVKRLLSDARRIWNKLDSEEKSPSLDDSFDADPTYKRSPPIDGLVLKVTMRDLPRSERPRNDLDASNLDHVWFNRDEMLSMIPPDSQPGTEYTLPPEICHRLARFHLIDSVGGETDAFSADEVQKAELKLAIVKASDDKLKFKVWGQIETNRPPNRAKDPYKRKSINVDMGCSLSLYGIAEYDRIEQQFSRFDLLAVGNRWGGSIYNFRHNDLKPAPIGYAVQLIKNVDENPTPPRFYSRYR